MAETITLRCEGCGALNRVDGRRTTSALPVCGRCGRPLPAGAGKPVAVRASEFKAEVLDWGGPVLVDFWAPWCGPCRAMSPVLEDLAGRRAGGLKIAKVNTDEEPVLASQFGIMSVPTLILFHNGKQINQLSGALPRHQLEAWIDSSLAVQP
jgi:thioredoxin 2